MKQFSNPSSPHSTDSGGEFEAESRPGKRWRPIASLLVLACLVVAGRFAGVAEHLAPAHANLVVSGEFVPEEGSYRPVMHQADILKELIDVFKRMLDILEGRDPQPSPEPPDPTEPEVPDEPVLTDEERDESNEAVDDAVDEGVDDPGERLQANWTYSQTTSFLEFMIDLIEDFRDANGMD